VIKTALKTSAFAAVLAGATFMGAPAFAGTSNEGDASHNNINVTVIGGYGVTCASVAVAGQADTSCNHDKSWAADNANTNGNR
jgi:hypothetical protein